MTYTPATPTTPLPVRIWDGGTEWTQAVRGLATTAEEAESLVIGAGWDIVRGGGGGVEVCEGAEAERTAWLVMVDREGGDAE